jgi:protein SCO1/2
VEKTFHVYAKKVPIDSGTAKNIYGVDHSSVIYLMGPDGKLVSYYDNPLSPDQLATAIKQRIS